MLASRRVWTSMPRPCIARSFLSTSALTGQRALGETTSGLLGTYEHQGVGLVVDQADVAHPVQNSGRHVGGTVALGQLLLKLSPTSRSHCQLTQHDLPGHVVRVRLPVLFLFPFPRIGS
jgi:hypothetical protein